MLRLTLKLTIMLIFIQLPYQLMAQETKLFWVHEDSYNGKIQCCNLDGSKVQDIITGRNMPCGLAIDDLSNPQKMYFCERGESKIIRANLDGTDQEDVVTIVPGIRDIELDVENRKIYWVRDTWDDDAVQRADMDGLNSNIEELFTSSYAGYGFYGIGLDHTNQKIYWTQAYNGCSDKIRSINFDMTGFLNVITYPMSTLLNPWDIDVYGNKIYWTDCGLSEDVILWASFDGSVIDTVIKEVDCQFFTIDTVAGRVYWTENNKVGCANLDGSERTELVSGLGNFLMGIGIGYNVTATSVDAPDHINRTFTLFNNYPNPFNPKTVISYQLPASSYVDLSIYDISGQRVVNLISEDQVAGRHELEWNARRIASGIYFVKLVAGEGLVQTQKMVLMK